MSTQLRLVEPPESRPHPAPTHSKGATKPPAKAGTRRSRTTGTARGAIRPSRTARRAASWGDWHLDAGTRRIGRAGVAAARQALEAAAEQELRAS